MAPNPDAEHLQRTKQAQSYVFTSLTEAIADSPCGSAVLRSARQNLQLIALLLPGSPGDQRAFEAAYLHAADMLEGLEHAVLFCRYRGYGPSS